MLLTIALSGMDSATETALRAALSAANQKLGGPWALVPETESQHVIVDMDSMYGPMSWLRLHAAGKQVIGLTSAPRVQTHFRLGRPFDETSILALLHEVAESLGASMTEAAMATDDAAPDIEAGRGTRSTAPEAAPDSTSPLMHGDAAPDIAQPPPGPAQSTATPAPPAARAFSPSLIDRDTDSGTGAAPAAAPAMPRPMPAPEASARELPFAAWLGNGLLRGRRRYRTDTGPTLLIDFDARQYHGPSTLKPLAQYFTGIVDRDAFETPDESTWIREATMAGPSQPLLRLQWLGGLLAGDGGPPQGHDEDTRYTLAKWPETEREYPRHFRIATAMMRGPATVEEIVAGSGVPAEEVYRFINANLATGHAEPVVEQPATPVDTQKAGGFFSRLRKR